MNKFYVPSKNNNISRCHFHDTWLCGTLIPVSQDTYKKHQPEQQTCFVRKRANSKCEIQILHLFQNLNLNDLSKLQ